MHDMRITGVGQGVGLQSTNSKEAFFGDTEQKRKRARWQQRNDYRCKARFTDAVFRFGYKEKGATGGMKRGMVKVEKRDRMEDIGALDPKVVTNIFEKWELLA